MKSDNKDLKLYIVILCSIFLYAILFAIMNIPYNILVGCIGNLNSSVKSIYIIIYQIISILICVVFFISWLREPYNKLIKQGKLYLTGLGAIVVYILMSEMQLLPFQLLNINVQSIPTYLKVIYLICYEAIMIGIIILIHFRKLKKDIKNIKINHKKYFSTCLKYWLIALFIMYMSNLFIYMIDSGIPSNEEIIREQFQLSPIYIFISAVLFAPVLEELIFRQSICNLFRNKWLFIILSGLIFGGMHVFTHEITSITDILYIIPYSAPGIAFAYMLNKTDNILVSMGFHMLHNGIMVALQFILVYFV